MNEINLEIDGRKLQAEEGMTVLEVAEKAGIKIPTLCHHKALSPFGACRLCTVEVTRGERSRLLTACTYPAEEGLVVKTDSSVVRQTRKMLLELLLARCPDIETIQQLAHEYGVKKSRLKKTKNEDCILCGLCTRICQERMGVAAINFVDRGINRKVDTPFEVYSDVCQTCGACAFICPTGAIKLEDITKNKPIPIASEFEAGLVARSPIYLSYPQAVPNVPAIDRDTCVHFLTDECGICQEFCEAEAIDFTQEDEEVDIDVGAVILAPGFDEFDVSMFTNYGYGRFPNVVSSIEFERILSASGPSMGKVTRPSDQKEPKRLAWIQCVGSRDPHRERGYCSSVCCMYATKEAVIAKEHDPDVETTIFYMDMRAYGKDFDKYIERARDKYGVKYVRSRIPQVTEDPATHNLRVTYETENGELIRDEFDMVVLSLGLEAPKDAQEIAEVFGIELNGHGFARTGSFEPLKTSRPGIFVGGAFSGPKDVPETVAQASGAAAEASSILSIARDTQVSSREYSQEIDVRYQGPRIGVFICHCGINIGGVVGVPDVAEYAKGFPGVVYVEENLYTCSQDTQEQIKRVIQEHRLNRVVVASCSPRTHEPLFQDTIREVGLNPYLLEMANIRDQCSWVHMHEPLKATEKAKDLVRMAVHKAALLEPLPTMTIDVNPRGLVIGGGLVGMEAALKLAEQGYEVYLVEKEDELGGNLRYIYHTLEGDSPRERIAELKERIQGHDGIQVFTGSEIEEIGGYVGNFRTRVRSGEGTKEFEHGIIIVATGAVEYRPTEYLYGNHAGVITQRELEKRIACDQLALGEGQNIVMIQCVGSRNEEHPYCSRVCCSEAIKNALRIKEMIPNTNVYILFRDIRTYGFKEDFYQKAREEGVVFIRYEQGREPVVESKGGKLEVRVYEPLLGEEIALETDLLVLGAATVPPDENQRLAQMLKIPLNEDGFFLEAHMKLRPVDLATEGIFLAGLAHGPKFIEESISQARAAVSRACTILSKKHIEVPAQISVVDEQKCVGCGLCEAVCPTHAIEVGEKRTPFGEKRVAQVNKALCKGCGICAASCRSGSIDLLGFTDEEIVSQLSRVVA